jgi:hypothetical protein
MSASQWIGFCEDPARNLRTSYCINFFVIIWNCTPIVERKRIAQLSLSDLGAKIIIN